MGKAASRGEPPPPHRPRSSSSSDYFFLISQPFVRPSSSSSSSLPTLCTAEGARQREKQPDPELSFTHPPPLSLSLSVSLFPRCIAAHELERQPAASAAAAGSGRRGQTPSAAPGSCRCPTLPAAPLAPLRGLQPRSGTAGGRPAAAPPRLHVPGSGSAAADPAAAGADAAGGPAAGKHRRRGAGPGCVSLFPCGRRCPAKAGEPGGRGGGGELRCRGGGLGEGVGEGGRCRRCPRGRGAPGWLVAAGAESPARGQPRRRAPCSGERGACARRRLRGRWRGGSPGREGCGRRR